VYPYTKVEASRVFSPPVVDRTRGARAKNIKIAIPSIFKKVNNNSTTYYGSNITSHSSSHPSPGPSEGVEADTVKKCRFYDAYDKDHNEKSLRQIARDEGTTDGTAGRWLRQRESLGSIAYRSSRKRSTKLGRPSKVTKPMCKMLVNPAQNPVRDQPYEA
jgi:hypothetical protein